MVAADPEGPDAFSAPRHAARGEHLNHAHLGRAGFADYATIGDTYTEGGSSPRAVVIHFTYQDKSDDSIWIRHFCSSSNDDTADPAGKFGEAVRELIRFTHREGLANPAIEAFARYNRDQYYPGLGMVKKLSIQNHLYLLLGAVDSRS